MLIVRGTTLEDVRLVVDADGTDAQVTELPDGTLTQVLDVSRIIPGLGAARGYALLRDEHAHAASGNLFATEDVYTLIETLGGSRLTDRAWLLGCWILAEDVAGNSIDHALVGISWPPISSVSSGGALAVMRATEFSALGLTAGATFRAAVEPDPECFAPFIHPMIIHPGGLILSASTSTVAAGSITARFEFLVWVGARGQHPPGLV